MSCKRKKRWGAGILAVSVVLSGTAALSWFRSGRNARFPDSRDVWSAPVAGSPSAVAPVATRTDALVPLRASGSASAEGAAATPDVDAADRRRAARRFVEACLDRDELLAALRKRLDRGGIEIPTSELDAVRSGLIEGLSDVYLEFRDGRQGVRPELEHLYGPCGDILFSVLPDLAKHLDDGAFVLTYEAHYDGWPEPWAYLDPDLRHPVELRVQAETGPFRLTLHIPKESVSAELWRPYERQFDWLEELIRDRTSSDARRMGFVASKRAGAQSGGKEERR